MKLTKKLFFTISLIFIFTGCSSEIVTNKDPVTNFSGVADVLMNDQQINCKVSRSSEGMSEIQITSPEELNGLTFKWLGNSYSVSFHGLSCENQSQFLPDSSLSKSIVNILNEVSKLESLTLISSDKDFSTYSGNSESGKFQIVVDNSTGFISNLSLDDSSLKVKFSDCTLT